MQHLKKNSAVKYERITLLCFCPDQGSHIILSLASLKHPWLLSLFWSYNKITNERKCQAWRLVPIFGNEVTAISLGLTNTIMSIQ